jgi:hypothetical protein
MYAGDAGALDLLLQALERAVTDNSSALAAASLIAVQALLDGHPDYLLPEGIPEGMVCNIRHVYMLRPMIPSCGRRDTRGIGRQCADPASS